MRSRLRVLLVFLAVATGSGACATSDQWAEWHKHPSHFASGDHLFFSLRHRGESPAPRVFKSDVEKGRAESWWGDAIVVRPEQLFEG